jgi:xylan 1,4-beta-xylosidase
MSSTKVEKTTRNVNIEINASRRSPMKRIWRYVGYDEPNYTYTPDGRELLAKLGAMEDGPYFIRCHFLLCTGDEKGRPKWGSTNAYTEDTEGKPVYKWDIIDKIIDTILDTGCVPFVEIGFMPLALTSAPEEIQYDGIRDAGWGYPPKDYSRWADLIRALGRHCLERYGLREVSRWYWELWNEPDIFYWLGTTADYCRLFDYTEAALHSVVPQAKLGGPATTSPARPEGGEYLRAFLAHCAEGENSTHGSRGTRLDFISFHTKGGSYRVELGAAKQTPSIPTLLSHVKAGLEIIGEFPVFDGLEVNLSECDPDGWAAGGKHDNPNLNFRNTEYYASFLADAVCKLIDFKIDGMVTWAFQFEEREYFEGLRSLSTNGIDKPVLNVFRMLARLGGTRLALSYDGSQHSHASENAFGVSAIAAEDQSESMQLFVVSHHDDWDLESALDTQVRVKGLKPNRNYSVVSYHISRDESNAYTAWTRMGEPQKPSTEQLDELRETSRLQPRAHPILVADESGEGDISFTLEGHSILLLEMSPQA